jgi:hypothetical protein
MVMDVIRSCSVESALFGENSDLPGPLRWYRCKPGAKAFPHWHAFGHIAWEPHPDEWTAGPGIEQWPRRWSRDLANKPDGSHFHGKPEYFLQGIPQQVYDETAPLDPHPCFSPAVVDLGTWFGNFRGGKSQEIEGIVSMEEVEIRGVEVEQLAPS